VKKGVMMQWIEKKFQLHAHGTTIKTEVIGGVTTYVTLSYILIVQPIVLSAAGMDFGAVLIATAVASAFACFMMGWLANYPVALAPAMGQNFYFTFVVVLGMGISWQASLTAVLIAGILFVLLTLLGIRRQVMDALPTSLMNALGVGIGLLIALMGFEWSGLIVQTPGTLVGLGDLALPSVQLALFSLTMISILLVRGVKAALIIALLVTTLVGIVSGVIEFNGLFSLPPSIEPTLFQLDFSLIGSIDFWSVVLIFLFLDIFDTMGTLVGLAPAAGLMRDGKVAISDKALLTDGTATVAGALLGTSTITTFVESASGIQAGARTGLAAIVTAVLLLLSLFLYPLIQTIAGGIKVSETLTVYPIIAPVLIVIGVMMMKRVTAIDWQRYTTAIPAFLTVMIMMLSVSITEGVAFGVISYSLLSWFDKEEKPHGIIHILAVVFVLRYIFLVH
jgi:AGZA family xanthine/uracil permease-like MFS transporter